jgi:C4-dicarboxylate transporter, DctQ subunit
VKNAETSEKQSVEPLAAATGAQAGTTGQSAETRTQAPEGIALRLQAVTGRLADGAGHLAAATLLILALSIVLGISLREVHIDNSWTYDLDLYMLAWLSFIGAVLTSLRDHHVTAGIALENLVGGRGTLLGIVRFAVVATFLVMFTISGFRQAYSSFVTNETTLDVVQWPVWIAKTALPLGAALWLAAEAHKLLRRFTGGRR